MKRTSLVLGFIVCAALASVYIYPIFSGLILLPLDLLVSNSSPWHLAGQIFLKNPYMGDSILQMFPWRHLTFTSLTSGIIPLWNPYQFLGMPFMAAMKPLVFYPANILFLFGELHAWNALLWLQLFLSLLFTFLLASSFGMSFFIALFTAVAFACNSLMISVLQFGSEGHVLLWLPVMLYFVKKYIDTEKPSFIIGIVGAVAFALLAGQLQYFAYMAAVVTGFALYYGKTVRAPVKTYIFPIFGVLIGGILAGIQLIPGIEMYQKSARGIIGSYATFSGGLMKPFQLLRLISPDWFGNPVSSDLRGGYIELSGYFGILPLFFMVFAVLYDRRNMFVRFFAVIAALSLLFSLNGPAQILYWLRIPIITGGYGSRLFSMFLFSGAILAGLGLQAFVKRKKNIPVVLYFIGVVALFVTFGLVSRRWGSEAFVTFQNIKIQLIVLAIFAAAAFLYARLSFVPRARSLFVICVLVLTFGDLFRMGYRFLTFSNEKFMYPETGVTAFVRGETEKYLGRVYGMTEPEVNTYLKIPGMNNKYELTRNPRMKYALDFVGASLIVVPKGVNPAIDLWNSSEYERTITKIYEDGRNDVFKNTTAMPRYGLFYDVRDNIPDEDALLALTLGSLDFGKTVILSEQLDSSFSVGTGSAGLISYNINDASFTVESNAPAIFYLSDSFDSGWHASVNGRETPVYHANYNFRGVSVPAGTSVVRFRYLPESFLVGAGVSGVGLLLTLSFIFVQYVAKRRKDRK